MRTFLEILGLRPTDAASGSTAGSVGETETVRKIARQLEALPSDRARYLAAFAYVLTRVANSDLSIDTSESHRIESILRQSGQLAPEQATLVAEIAKAQNRMFGGTENFQVTRELSAVASREEKLHLVDCLYAVAAADGTISAEEELEIRRIGDELGLSPRQVIEIRGRYNELRSVIQRLDPS